MIKQNENYKVTTDLALASYLSLSVSLVKVLKVDTKRCEFYFKDTKPLEALISAFYSNQAKVNPLDYFTAIKNLKTRIYMEVSA